MPDSASRNPAADSGGNAPASVGTAEKFKITLISWLGYWAIRLIGRSLRWRVEGWEHFESIRAEGKGIIYAFWHGRILCGTYFWRGRGIVVMTSRNKDGEYIARVIRRFGYGAARGSSSRGGSRALAEMARELRRGTDVAFTLDGPRGPRHIAKPGAVWLAAKTGSPIMPFHFSAEKKWVLSSWDRFQIPRPFTRVLLTIAPPIYVSPDADEVEMENSRKALQSSLEGLLRKEDSAWPRPVQR